MKQRIMDVWEMVRKKNYKLEVQQVELSDGFSLRELLKEDFENDVAQLAVISLCYSIFFITIFGVIGVLIWEPLGGVILFAGAVQVLSCVFAFLPLSRFWLPESVAYFMVGEVNYGLGIYNWANQESQFANFLVKLFVQLPVLAAWLIKYIILLPLYELAKVLVGDRIVGIVRQNLFYYAGVADWYVLEILNKPEQDLTSDDLFALSHLYTEIKDVNEDSPAQHVDIPLTSNTAKAARKAQNIVDNNRPIVAAVGGVVILLIIAAATGLFSGRSSKPQRNYASQNQTTQTPPNTQRPSPNTANTHNQNRVPQNAQNTLRSEVASLRVRQYPNASSKVIEGLDEGEQMNFLNQTQGKYTTNLRGRSITGPWMKMQTKEGIIGWVFSGAVKYSGTDNGYPQAVIQDKDGFTNLRKGPGGTYDVVTKVKEGERFHVLNQSGNWWQIRLNSGVKGYMHKSRVRMI